MLLSLKSDFVFKYFFTHQKGQKFLISFLDAILKLPSRIEAIEILNPNLPNENIHDKNSFLDLRVRLKNQTQVCIEMQARKYPEFRSRIVYYLAKAHQGQVKTGDEYSKIPPTVSISVVNYVEFDDTPDAHTVYFLQRRETGTIFSEDISIHFLELPKIKDKVESDKSVTLEDWGHFFNLEKLPIEELDKLMEKKDMKDAYDFLREVSEDEKTRIIAEQIENSEFNYKLRMNYAKEEGKIEGKIEGKMDIAKLMLAKKMELKLIAEITELSEKEILQIEI